MVAQKSLVLALCRCARLVAAVPSCMAAVIGTDVCVSQLGRCDVLYRDSALTSTWWVRWSCSFHNCVSEQEGLGACVAVWQWQGLGML